LIRTLKNISWKNNEQNLYPNLAAPDTWLEKYSKILKKRKLNIIYFAYFHAVMQYGTIFWKYQVRVKNNFSTTKKNN
jgi:hypothetical protein